MPDPPITNRDRRRREPPGRGRRKKRTHLSMAEVNLSPGDEISLVRDERIEDLFRLKCATGPRGTPPHNRRDVEGIQLDADSVSDDADVLENEGMVPEETEVTFRPEEAERTRVQEHLDLRTEEGEPLRDRETGEELDRGGIIFGTDDRYLFHDHAFPWRTTGRIRTAGGTCSGTTIGPRHVLTASHCVNWNDEGGAGWITFSPGSFDGHRPWGEIAATQVIYWLQAPGMLNDQQTAFDYVVLVMEEEIGNVIGYPGYRTYDDDWNGGEYWQYTGYPGELAGGMRPAFQGDCVVSSTQGQSLSGNSAQVLGHFNEFTPGQSGGAVWGWWDDEPWPRVVGVGSTIGSTAQQRPHGRTIGDNEFGGGAALSKLIHWARQNYPA